MGNVWLRTTTLTKKMALEKWLPSLLRFLLLCRAENDHMAVQIVFPRHKQKQQRKWPDRCSKKRKAGKLQFLTLTPMSDFEASGSHHHRHHSVRNNSLSTDFANRDVTGKLLHRLDVVVIWSTEEVGNKYRVLFPVALTCHQIDTTTTVRFPAKEERGGGGGGKDSLYNLHLRDIVFSFASRGQNDHEKTLNSFSTTLSFVGSN